MKISEIFLIIGWLCVCSYIPINRICACFERCVTADAFIKTKENGGEKHE